MYNEGEDKGKDKGKRCEGEAKGEQVEELNDEGCTRYLGGNIRKRSICLKMA